VQLADLVAAEQQVRVDAAAGKQEFLDFLEEFRHTAVLVPFDDQGALWSAEVGGIRWILAFSDEGALARLARSRRNPDLRRPAVKADEGTEAWDFRKVRGSRLLDSVIPAVGRPCGVALDAGSKGGTVLPPVAGIVPDKATVEAYAAGTGRR
jgi:hypothetical protein